MRGVEATSFGAHALTELQLFRATGDCRVLPPQNGDIVSDVSRIDAELELMESQVARRVLGAGALWGV